MKGSSSLAGLFLIFLTGLPALSQEANLSYRLAEDQRYFLDIDIQQNTLSESVNSSEINLYSKLLVEFRVDSLDAYGLYHMEVVYRDLLLSMLSPGMSIDINSQSGQNRMLSLMMDSLLNRPFHVSMKENGELHKLSGLKEVFQDLTRVSTGDSTRQGMILNTLEEAYGPNAFQSYFNLFVSYFPVIQPIKNWTRDLTYYFNTKAVQMVNRYFLSKTSGERIIIQGMGMLNSVEEFREEISLGEVSSTVSGSQTYDFQVDRESGWLVQCVSRQRVQIETTIIRSNIYPAGLSIPSYTETLFEVKGYRKP